MIEPRWRVPTEELRRARDVFCGDVDVMSREPQFDVALLQLASAWVAAEHEAGDEVLAGLTIALNAIGPAPSLAQAAALRSFVGVGALQCTMFDAESLRRVAALEAADEAVYAEIVRTVALAIEDAEFVYFDDVVDMVTSVVDRCERRWESRLAHELLWLERARAATMWGEQNELHVAALERAARAAASLGDKDSVRVFDSLMVLQPTRAETWWRRALATSAVYADSVRLKLALADALGVQNRWSDAHRLYREVLAALPEPGVEALPKEDPDPPEEAQHWSYAIAGCARVRHRAGDVAEARHLLSRARRVWELELPAQLSADVLRWTTPPSENDLGYLFDESLISFNVVRDTDTADSRAAGVDGWRTFGPEHDYACLCDDDDTFRDAGRWCLQCRMEILPARARAVVHGHLELALPVLHPWGKHHVASLLGLSPTELTGVASGAISIAEVQTSRTRDLFCALGWRGRTAGCGVADIKHELNDALPGKPPAGLDLFPVLAHRRRLQLETWRCFDRAKAIHSRLVISEVPVLPPAYAPVDERFDTALVRARYRELERVNRDGDYVALQHAVDQLFDALAGGAPRPSWPREPHLSLAKDADAHAQVVALAARLRSWLRAHRPSLLEGTQPVDEDTLVSVQQQVGATLPAGFMAWMSSGLPRGRCWGGSDWKTWIAGKWTPSRGIVALMEVMYDAESARPLPMHCIPFLQQDCGGTICIDLLGTDGVPGQVVEHCRIDGGLTVLAPNFVDWLTAAIEHLEELHRALDLRGLSPASRRLLCDAQGYAYVNGDPFVEPVHVARTIADQHSCLTSPPALELPTNEGVNAPPLIGADLAAAVERAVETAGAPGNVAVHVLVEEVLRQEPQRERLAIVSEVLAGKEWEALDALYAEEEGDN